jgi:anti-anti-sigma factor
MDVSIERRECGDGVELAVAGRLDAECAGELARAVEDELRHGFHSIALDLDGVAFLSSAGIRVLFETHRNARTAGGSCLIRTASPPVRKVLDLTRLTPMLMAPQPGGTVPAVADPQAPAPQPPRTIRAGSVLLHGFERSLGSPLRPLLIGTPGMVPGLPDGGIRHAIPRHACGLGLAALADDAPVARRAGEMLAACGAVFHRPPQPFAAVDYLVGTGDLVPEADFLSGLVWHGVPSGRTGFEPADEEAGVPLDDLAAAVLAQSDAAAIALVIAAEVHGLVGVELIRPPAESSAHDHPLSPDRDVAARWLSFSREPVHVRRTALVVGVASRGCPAEPLAAFVRPLGSGDLHGHFHAAVFPHRPLRRGVVELVATVDDLAASEPLAVMHLLADPQPVLGSGRPEFFRGCCWFAPLAVPEAAA